MRKVLLILFIPLLLAGCTNRKSMAKETEIPAPQQAEEKPEPQIPEVKIEPGIKKEDPLDKKITIVAQEITMGSLLELISLETGLNTVYDPGIDTTKTISVNFRNTTIRDVLEKITEQLGLVYKIENNFLEIKSYDTWTFELEAVPVSTKPSISVGGNVIPEAEGLFGSYMIKSQYSGGEFDFYKEVEEDIKSLLTKAGQFTLNRNTGVLIVSDSARALRRIKEYIEKVKDLKRKQVHIEVKIIEVTLDKSRDYGIDWSFIKDFLVNGTHYALNLKQGLSLTQAIFDINLTGTRFNTLLNFLASQGKVNILSQPSLSLLNGETAILSVGRVLAYWELTAQAGGAEAGTPVVYPTKKSVLKGILLGLTPLISSDSTITLQLTPIVSDITRWEEYTWNNQKLQAPDVDIREAQTTLRIKNGETVLIGGLISRKESVYRKKIPLLGDIPFLGKLFSSEEKKTEKTELVILITPTLQ